MIVNTSITRFKDGSRFCFEPSFARQLAGELGLRATAVTFDLSNACAGMLTGVYLLDRMIRAGIVRNGMVVSGEQPGAGFGPVAVRGTDDADGSAGTRGYLETAGMGAEGRCRITVERQPEAVRVERLVALAADTVGDYARDHGLSLDRTLVLCTRAAPDFADRLAGRLGLVPGSVRAPGAPGTAGGEPLTAAPVVGYLNALERGLPPGKDQLLLVTAGAGPSAACAGYRPRGR
ncbi:hypothetical protein ACFV2N_46680 [Streptomyces sp. NPDC059680]|uniref:hypothetical protein n=1 Tax=Streptomyces sp. NPDC059680 TaxID=3346904 RepID=UPI00369FF2AA